jgi:hypothetical protein
MSCPDTPKRVAPSAEYEKSAENAHLSASGNTAGQISQDANPTGSTTMTTTDQNTAAMRLHQAICDAQRLLATQPTASAENAAPSKPQATIPDQVAGRRQTEVGQRRIRTPEGVAIDRAVAHFADVLTLLGAASCRGVPQSLAQELVLMAHANTMFGLDELDSFESTVPNDAG